MAEVALLILALLLGAAALVWTLQRSEDILRGWAAENQYRLVSYRYCWFFRGPFWWRSTDEQAVYRVTVEDRGGRRRSGYVRCGGWCPRPALPASRCRLGRLNDPLLNRTLSRDGAGAWRRG